MEDLTRPFDPDQTHQRHFDCVCDRDYVKYLIKGELEVLAQEQDAVFASPKVPLRDSEGRPFEGYVIGMRAGEERYRENFPCAIQFLATTSEQRKNINVCSWYPVCDNGTEVDVTLTAIHEWTSGMEATLEGTILDGTREVVFFDTRYAAKKLDYRIGETYKFKLAAFAYCIELLDKPKMKLTAEQAEDFARKTGCEIKRDAKGNARPMSIDKGRRWLHPRSASTAGRV